jgi:predicted kinase
MAGHGGSGKSTLARRIAERFGGVTVDLDVIKTALLEAGLDWNQSAKASYGVIYALADDLISTGTRCVVIDTPSYWEEIHRRLSATATAHQARYVFLECEAAETLRAERLATRPTRRSQIPMHGGAPTDAPQDAAPVHARPIVRPPDAVCLFVDTGNPLNLDLLIEQIERSAT